MQASLVRCGGRLAGLAAGVACGGRRGATQQQGQRLHRPGLVELPALPASPPTAPAQFLVSQAAQRTFLVSDGRLRLLEGGVEEYVAQLSGGAKKKASGGGGKAAAAGGAAGSAAGSSKPTAPAVPKNLAQLKKAARR